MKHAHCTLRAAALALALTLPAAAFAQSGGNFGDCEISNKAPVAKFKTIVPGVLTIAGPIASSPTGYRGANPSSIRGGDLYCLTAEIAHRGGATSIKIINLPWDALISGKSSDFDFTLMNAAITPERKLVVDFSDAYRAVYPVVMVRSDKSMTEEQFKKSKVGIIIGAKRYDDFLRKDLGISQIRQFDSNDDMSHALMAGFIDAALSDYTGLMPLVGKSREALKIVARYPGTGLDLGVLFPKGSSEVGNVNAVLSSMKADGTLQAIETKWLQPVLGGDPGALPIWGE